MKKPIVVILSILLVTVMVLGACGTKTTTITTGVTSTSTTTTTFKPIVWKAATTTPAMAPPGKALTMFAEKVAEETGGRLTFQIFYTSSLFEAKEALRSMEAGIGQISDLWPGAMPGVMPLQDVFSLPGLGWPDTYISTEIVKEVMANSPALRGEFGSLIPYGLCVVNPPTIIHSKSVNIKTQADLQGLMMLGANASTANFWEALGATTVFIPYEDTYLSWDKGIFEACASSAGWMMGAGVMDIPKYHTVMGTTLQQSVHQLVINQAAWDALPADIQQILKDLESYYAEQSIELEAEAEVAGRGYAEGHGQTYYDLPAAELANWLTVAKPLHEQWIAEREAAGTQGAQEVYDLVVATIAKYKK